MVGGPRFVGFQAVGRTHLQVSKFLGGWPNSWVVGTSTRIQVSLFLLVDGWQEPGLPGDCW